MKRIAMKFSGIIASLALMVTIMNVNSIVAQLSRQKSKIFIMN